MQFVWSGPSLPPWAQPPSLAGSIPLSWPPSPCQQSFCHKSDSAWSSIRYFVLGFHTPAIAVLRPAAFLKKYFFSVALTGSLLLPVGFLGAASGATLCCSVGFSLWCLLLLQNMGSVVVAHSLSCSAASGVFPDLGWNPCPLYCRQIPVYCATRKSGAELFDDTFFVNVGLELRTRLMGRLRWALFLLFLCYWLALRPTAPLLLHSTRIWRLFRDHCFSGCHLVGERGGPFPGTDASVRSLPLEVV